MNEAGKFLEAFEFEELMRRVRIRMSRMKVADLVLVVSELAGAFDKVAFGSVLDRQDGWKNLGLSERKNLFDVLINISETWGSEDVYGGYFVTDEKLWGVILLLMMWQLVTSPAKLVYLKTS